MADDRLELTLYVSHALPASFRAVANIHVQPTIGVCRFLLLVSLLMAGCGVTQPTPVPSVTGSWFASYLSGHTGRIALQLEQEGSRIRGTACAVNISLLFKDAPVSGDYPSLRFTVEASAYPDYVGARFVGLFQEDGTLKGTFRGTDVTFIHLPRLEPCP